MYELTFSKPDIIRLGPFTTSKQELQDLFRAWLAISLAFGIVMTGGITTLFHLIFFKNLGISMAVVGTGFLFHELAHKLVAQRYKCWAEFRSFNTMLWLAIGCSLFGFVFAAPGAVMISGTITKDRNGKISLAGPLMNIILAIIFLGLSFVIKNTLALELFSYGFMINTWLAIFNLIPVWNLDGKKIWQWSKPAWIVVAIAAGSLLALTFA